MRHQTYRTAYDEAHAELQDITMQFERLRLRKDQVERVLDALRPFLGFQSDSTSESMEAYATSESEFTDSDLADFTYTQVSVPTGESIQMTSEAPTEEPVAVGVESNAEQDAYFRQASSDPFQRRIDDALWGWQQRPEGLLSPI
jgi:hypothetical protein